MDFAFNLMPNQPEINTNILTQHIHADSNKVRKNSAVGAHKILSLLGGAKAPKFACSKSTITVAIILSSSMFEFLIGFSYLTTIVLEI